MKRSLLIILLIITIFLCSCGKKVETVDNTLGDEPQGLQYIEAFGIVKGDNAINIALPISAMVEKVNVTEGQRVSKDEAIVVFDLKYYNLQLKEKQAELRGLKIERAALEAELAKNWDDLPDIKVFKSEKDYAAVYYEEAVAERDKQKKLLDSGIISPSEFEIYEKAVNLKGRAITEIELEEEKAEYSFNEGKNRITTELEGIESKIAAMEVGIRTVGDKIKKDYINSDCIISTIDNGMVFDLDCTAGDLLQEGKKALSLMDLDSLYIEANVNEEFIKGVKKGSKVLIIPEADKGREYKGTVTFISQGAFNINGQTNVPVHIEVENIDDFLKYGFNVDLQIFIE